MRQFFNKVTKNVTPDSNSKMPAELRLLKNGTKKYGKSFCENHAATIALMRVLQRKMAFQKEENKEV